VNGTFISFDAPNAVDTLALSINRNGDIAGYSVNASNVAKGFVRTASGTITSIHPAGASATHATSINAAGDIVGYYTDSAGTHGFVRTP
jgi:hypothetical protein